MHKQGAFDYIMLETTGLADPGKFPLPDGYSLVYPFEKVRLPRCFGKMKTLAKTLCWMGLYVLWMVYLDSRYVEVLEECVLLN
jgi:hypothetical protein